MNYKKHIQRGKTSAHSTLNAGWMKRTFVWLRRIGLCRGFGVQSPWAYSMVRYVINEHYPYYAYAPLAKQFKSQSHVRKKLNELYLRLANKIQPSAVVDFCDDDETFWAYINAGCRKAKRTKQTDWPADGVVLLRLRAEEEPPIYINKVWQAAKDGWVAVIEDIHSSANARQQWREWTEKRDDTVSFDLYYCGLLFFDGKRYKQNYIINF